MKCEVCGESKHNDYYKLCVACYKLKEEGSIIQCNKCGKFHYKNQNCNCNGTKENYYCKRCGNEITKEGYCAYCQNYYESNGNIYCEKCKSYHAKEWDCVNRKRKITTVEQLRDLLLGSKLKKVSKQCIICKKNIANGVTCEECKKKISSGSLSLCKHCNRWHDHDYLCEEKRLFYFELETQQNTKDKKISDLQKDNNNKDFEIKNLKKEIISQQEIITGLQTEKENNNKLIQNLQKDIQEKDKIIQNKNNELTFFKNEKAIEKNCLFYFDTIEQFKTIVEEHNIDNWLIYALPIKERKSRIDYSDKYIFLDNQNQKTNTTNNQQEIVSWIDTMNFMYYVIDSLQNQNELHIIQELKIPFSNEKRPDYILIRDNKLLIIEFSFKKLGDDYQYENKLTQAMGYKELLTNLLPNHINIGTYTCLIKAEATANGDSIYVNSKYSNKKHDPNYDSRIEMAKFIDNFFENTTQDALKTLTKIVS